MAKAKPAVVEPQRQQVPIDVTPPSEAREGLALVATARSLLVSDKETHRVALEFIRGAKLLKRKIEEHWSAITRTVDEQKRTLLTLKRRDLEPVEQALQIAEAMALDYQNAEERRVREEQDRRRKAAEEQAKKDREAELARAEAEALKAEATSDVLSARESAFVDMIVAHVGGTLTPERIGFYAGRVGYKGDAERVGQRLMATEKILDAIQARRTAAAIREQAEARRRQPLDVVTGPAVVRETAKVAGVRANLTYWSAEVVDRDVLIDAVIAGKVDRAVLSIDQSYLNRAAQQLHEAFDTAYPGCRHVKKQGIGG